MQSKRSYWLKGLGIAAFGVFGYVQTGGTSAAAVVQLTWVTFLLVGGLFATAHPSTGPAKLKLQFARVILVVTGVVLTAAGIHIASLSTLWGIAGLISLAGIVVFYGVFIRIPWTKIEEGLVAYQSTGETDVEIIPDETWYTLRFVFFGWVVMMSTAIIRYVFRVTSLGGLIIVGSWFLAGGLLMLGSPLAGTVGRTVRLYQALVVVVGGGFALGGLYPFTTGAEPPTSMIYTFIGGVVLIRGWLVDWETVRAVVEEYRAVDRPSELGFRELKRRVEERRQAAE